MKRDERQQLRDITHEVTGWIDTASRVRAERAKVANASVAAKNALRDAVVEVPEDGQTAWRVMPLRATDTERLEDIARYDGLPKTSDNFRKQLANLTANVAGSVHDVQAVIGVRRFFSGSGTRDSANKAADYLRGYHKQFISDGLRAELERVATEKPKPLGGIAVSDALSERGGLRRRTSDLGQPAEVLALSKFPGFVEAAGRVLGVVAEEAKCRAAAVDAGNGVRRAETARIMADMGVDRLREATRDKIRTTPLTDAGITTVSEVLQFPGLDNLPGIGVTTAARILGAAQTLWQTTFDEMPARIDIRARTPEATELLRRLRIWNQLRKNAGGAAEMQSAQELATLAKAIDRSVTHLAVFCAPDRPVEQFSARLDALLQRSRLIAGAGTSPKSDDLWDDFVAHPADYFALLAELGFIAEDEEKTHGDLPEDIVNAVRAIELKTDYLAASLRGYQSFGARFVLAQRKVIIGDEMGLGKTVEAIAVLAHLRAKGQQSFLVVCPAAVVTNWVREVSSKSKLAAHRLHGPDRHWAAKNWIRNAGVAVTTFETLPWLENNVEMPQLGCVVVDEAHYIKNPEAQRTRRTTRLIDSCERAVLLTGTPLENRIDEFRNLVGYLRPDLVLDANEYAPSKFRRQVAGAYLRRNQEDVLTELPELVEVEEWIPMSDADLAAYRAALDQGNFMALRQAGMNQALKSAKLQRLIEIVDEAESNGRRVVVFSHFLEVLRGVARHLPGRVFGPLTGSVQASQRQVMVDDFSATRKGAVLVAQILAGGVGLNIQAASVVVICEPQVKPTTEWQAIARAHRMGQLESVQVHRLLSDEGVDLRLREILARKKELFESFARQSATAESAPEAYDVSEAELAREIIASERERLFGQSAPPNGRASAPPKSYPPAPRVNPTPAEQVSTPAKLMKAPTSPRDRPAVPPRKPATPSDKYANRPRRLTAQRLAAGEHEVAAEATVEQLAAAAQPVGLQPYPVFAESLPSVAGVTLERVVKNVVRIVAVEGPVMGWRIHQVYKKCSDSSDSHEEFTRLVNRAISAAERQQLITSENPLNQPGNKPRTYRLLSQPKVIARQRGPRSVDIIPPAEMVEYRHRVSLGAAVSEEEVLRRVVNLLGLNVITNDLRRAAAAAKKLQTAN
ncbi:DEAD/DEAH box helicase [Candidatus Mycobacterium methanotrophicum]|uniref:SNF2-related protein n=1 Tax=Candidatus Mycobacterium methanotrophicum TaxID=2943498 RepID=A0ABY4QNH0_9MYCO|nr:SNF2-related protein [Candidatus Mycobacterium methanotrophicum]UQX11406.1 SNF2-related protein [Candidatus Mycobacterium methanotrophicum]